MLLHLNVFFVAERIQIDELQDVAISKLEEVMRTGSLFQLIRVLGHAYDHGIPPCERGEALKSRIMDEAVANSNALSEMEVFNQLLESNGAFARDFVKALCNIHASTTSQDRMRRMVGGASAICRCNPCRFSWFLPSRSINSAHPVKCPLCADATRVRIDRDVRMWKCSSGTCDHVFFSEAPATHQAWICPMCKGTCHAVN